MRQIYENNLICRILLRRFIETCTNEPQDVCAFFLEIVFYFHKTFFAHVSNRQDASTGAMQSQDFSYKKAMKPSCSEASRWCMKGRLAFHELAYPFDGNAEVKVVRTVEFGKVHANQVALGVDYRTAA